MLKINPVRTNVRFGKSLESSENLSPDEQIYRTNLDTIKQIEIRLREIKNLREDLKDYTLHRQLSEDLEARLANLQGWNTGYEENHPSGSN